jgi:plasmid stability protein
MKAITLRNLPANLDKAIRKRARAKRMSVNKAVIGLLEEHLTQDKTKQSELHHDLDDLSGSWTADVAAAFDEALVKQRTIDPDMWK